MIVKEQTQREKTGREKLKKKKPLVYDKVIKVEERIANKQSVALLQLQYSYRCNMHCKHCAIEEFKKKGGRTLNSFDVKYIADQADAMGLASICLSGGEPLIFPDLEEVIDAIGPQRFTLSMDTNGYLLNEEKIKWLVAKGVDRIHLSIDGLKENHAKFRGVKDSWQRCINALPLCTQHGLGVIINIVVTKQMVHSGELVKELEFVKEFGHHASMIYAKPVGSFENSQEEVLNTADLDYVQSLTQQYNCSTHLSPNNGIEFGCLCFKKHFSITAYGDVLPCPWVPISMGNIFEEGLAEIVQRGLNMKWFSYDCKYTCHSGNRDSEFFQRILPQIRKTGQYPASWKDIDWK